MLKALALYYWLPLLLPRRTALERFRSERPPEPTALKVTLLLLVLVILVLVCIHLVRRYFAMLASPAARRALFLELSAAHRLTPAEQRLLRRLARRERLDNPARLFVEKRHLEACAHSNTEPAYRDLFEKLFSR